MVDIDFEKASDEQLINGDLYDFRYAQDEYCVDVGDFVQNDFERLLEDSYIVDFFSLRRAYQMRNWKDFRARVHKIKSLFK